VLAHYQDHLFQQVGEQLTFENDVRGFRRWGTRQIEIDEVRLLNDEGEESTIFQTGDSLTIELAYSAHDPIIEPEFGLAIHRHDGVHVTGPNSRVGGLALGVVQGQGLIRYDSVHPIAYDYHEEGYSFRVVEGGTEETEGFMTIDASWKWYQLPVDRMAESAYAPDAPIIEVDPLIPLGG
jgi:hypothetical protein